MTAKQPIDKQIFNRLTKLYLMALLAVALLSVVGQLVIQLFLKDILGDSHIVNMAGRQRMLSQKITKSVLLMVQKSNNSDTTKILKYDLGQDLETWAENHRGLKSGQLISEKKLFFKNSMKIDSLFVKLEPVFNKIYENTNRIIRKKNDLNQLKIARDIILENEPLFLNTMIEIVAQYDIEAEKRVDKMQKIESVLFSMLMLVLLLEGFFIFKPIANNIRLVIGRLANSETELRDANNKLLTSNIKLSEAKKDLFKATEEKYKLQIAEEKVRSSALIEGQEVERKRLALELHDGIGQMLTGLKLQAEHLKTFKFVNEKQQKSFDDLQSLISETIMATRSVSFNLAPSVLSDFGLIAAIKLLVEQYQKAGRIPIEIIGSIQKRLAEKIEIGLYRMVQEAIHNAQKYSKANLIKIYLEEKENSIALQISDDGIGFDLNLKRKSAGIEGTGINNMHTRVELLNGNFQIFSEVKKGTEIIVNVPS
jgi:signal transduction histidine kinase